MPEKIEPDLLYHNDYPSLDEWIAPRGTRAKWRHQNQGPAYVKRGALVSYYGRDIIDWHEAQRVETLAAGPCAASGDASPPPAGPPSEPSPRTPPRRTSTMPVRGKRPRRTKPVRQEGP